LGILDSSYARGKVAGCKIYDTRRAWGKLKLPFFFYALALLPYYHSLNPFL
jgi:hypothetical protein